MRKANVLILLAMSLAITGFLLGRVASGDTGAKLRPTPEAGVNPDVSEVRLANPGLAVLDRHSSGFDSLGEGDTVPVGTTAELGMGRFAGGPNWTSRFDRTEFSLVAAIFSPYPSKISLESLARNTELNPADVAIDEDGCTRIKVIADLARERVRMLAYNVGQVRTRAIDAAISAGRSRKIPLLAIEAPLDAPAGFSSFRMKIPKDALPRNQVVADPMAEVGHIIDNEDVPDFVSAQQGFYLAAQEDALALIACFEGVGCLTPDQSTQLIGEVLSVVRTQLELR